MRVVSLAPGLTEVCFALGRGDWVVGVDEHSDRPAAVADLPRVGTISEPDIDAIRTLGPDLVLVFDMAPGRVSPPAALTTSGLPVELLSATRLTEVGSLFRDTARLLEAPGPGDDLAEELDSGLASRRAGLSPLEPRPRVYVELWPRPVLALGRASWIHDLLELAGGDNVFGDEDVPNLEVDGAAVAARHPDVMLTTWGSLATGPQSVYRRKDWQDVGPVRRRRVASVAVDCLKRPVPRLVHGFDLLASVLRAAAAGAGHAAGPRPV